MHGVGQDVVGGTAEHIKMAVECDLKTVECQVVRLLDIKGEVNFFKFSLRALFAQCQNLKLPSFLYSFS